jgi:tetratricopeptide (TPR) repeat protein
VLRPQEIYPQLVDRFLLDLAENLPARSGRACRGVLFLDTAEALRIGLLGEAKIHQREQWLRDLHRTDSSVLLVLAGRDQLSWADADRAYRDRRYLEQHLVGGLSQRDSRIFLQSCGITNPSLQQAVLRVSVDTETAVTETNAGYHPFSLGLCGDTLRNEPGADPASFDMAPGDVTRLADRFLKSLVGPAYEIWVRRLALTPRFDEPAARAAFSASRDVNQDAAWQYLGSFSFVRAADEPGWWTLHFRMRQALTEAYPDRAAADHQFWQDYWQRRRGNETDDCAALAWYHQYALQPKEALKAWSVLAKNCRNAHRMAAHYKLLDWWEPTRLEEEAPASPEAAAQLRCLGVELASATLGSLSENLHRAIVCYEAALCIYTETDFPTDWATTQHNLGYDYSNLPTGDRSANLKEAIACYQAALRVRTETDFPADWAATQICLGLAYANLPTGDRRANLKEAIACYQAALRVRTETDFPTDWAATQNNLGSAYADLPTGDRAENLEKAIACYQAALRIYTETDFPTDWAMTQNNLGSAFAILPTGDRSANLKQAIASYQAALRIYTETNFPANWAMTQRNLGAALEELSALTKELSLLLRAIDCFEAAVRGFVVCGLADEAKVMRKRADEDRKKL